MGMITSIRAPLPVAEAPLAPIAEVRQPGPRPAGASTTGAPQDLARPAPPPPSQPETNQAQLLTTRTAAESSATQAAEAARAAYIRASIAAGINPLPLS